MTFMGWLFMSVSWVLIMLLVLFCFMRILRKKKID